MYRNCEFGIQEADGFQGRSMSPPRSATIPDEPAVKCCRSSSTDHPDLMRCSGRYRMRSWATEIGWRGPDPRFLAVERSHNRLRRWPGLCAVSFPAWSQRASFCVCAYVLVAIGGRREDDPDREPAVGHGMRVDAGLVGGSNGPDDGESEPVPVLVVRAARIEPLKGLEEAVDLSWRDACSGIGHRQHGLAAGHLGHDLDAAADDVVAYGVGEQIGDEPFDEQRVSIEECRCRHLVDVDPQSVDLGLEVDKGRGDGGSEVDGFVSIEAAFTAGEGEKSFDAGVPARRSRRAPPRRWSATRRWLYRGRRAQLVRGCARR